MTGEQFLNSIRHLDCEINALEIQRGKLSDQRLSILERSYPSNSLGVRVQNGISSKTEALAVQLADLVVPEPEVLARKLNALMERTNKRIDELIDRKQRAAELIELLPDARYRALLTHRYHSNLKWDTVADLMGYDTRYVRDELKAAAILAFETEWKKVPSKSDIHFI